MKNLATKNGGEIKNAERWKILLAAWHADKPRSQETRMAGIELLALHLGMATTCETIEKLLGNGRTNAVNIALGFKAHLTQREKMKGGTEADPGLSAGSIGTYLGPIRSLAKFARDRGIVDFDLAAVKSPVKENRRDSRGPNAEDTVKLWATLQIRSDDKGLRDRALFRLMFDLALRRASVCALDVSDIDLENKTVRLRVLKGRREAQTRELPPSTILALSAYLKARGDAHGPLFLSQKKGFGLHGRHRDGRLTAIGLWSVVKGWGIDAKISRPLKPHGLRHTSITVALDKTRGDFRAVAAHSGHRNWSSLTPYDDERLNAGAATSRLVAASV